ncbi:MAG: 3-oxoacyl-ACP synthase III [Candidatus Dadabacteria bacterium]|nr:MAG: 3-oxoacyl-ACP synthase III [Candidatus Dadabacteria bacterium]
MLSATFNNVFIESMAVNLPSKRVTSEEIEERLAPLYERLNIPKGTFEKLTGIRSRYFWENGAMPSQVATVAGHKALKEIGFPKKYIKALFSCSITRDYFEPATACLIHHELGLEETAMVTDVSNACLGFMNGIFMMATLIESGTVPAGIVLSGETIYKPIDYCINYILEHEELSRSELLNLLPTLTLGSGAVAYVLAHRDIATNTHRILGGVGRSATRHHNLCNGNGDYYVAQLSGFDPIMTTESSKLVSSAAKLGRKTWKEFSKLFGWTKDDVDHIFCHQVGKQVNGSFYKTIGLDGSKEFTIYQEYGNLASAALPTALVIGAKEKDIKQGDKILLTGFGSGLNSLFLGLEW